MKRPSVLMRRLRSSMRPLALALAAVTAAVANGGPLSLHDCPRHDPVAAVATTAAPTSDAVAGHPSDDSAASHARASDHGQHGAASDARKSDHRDAGHGSSHEGPCRCVGDCHAGSAAPHRARAAATIAFAAATHPEAILPLARPRLAGPKRFLRPPANAPPLSP
jgi:hypothetical protein